MKKLLIGLLFVSSSVIAGQGDSKVKPKEESTYVTSERFVTPAMTGKLETIVTDTKTGCQYMILEGGGYSRPSVHLGCFEEYRR